MDPENSPNVAINHPYFILIFSIFYCYFSFGKAHFSLFGSAPWTLKTTPNIIINHPYFILIFSIFYCYFSFREAHVSLFGSAPWTLKTTPNVVINSEQHPELITATSKPPTGPIQAVMHSCGQLPRPSSYWL